MNKMLKLMALLAALFLLTNGGFYAVLADHDEYKDRRWNEKPFDWGDDDDDDDDHDREGKKRWYQKRYRSDSKHYGKRYLTPVNNPTFKEECGACHFAYQPELLPSGSWGKILSGLEDHFGEVIELDPESRKVIT